MAAASSFGEVGERYVIVLPFYDWGWQKLVSLFFLLSDGTPEKRPFVSVQTVVAGGSKPPLEES